MATNSTFDDVQAWPEPRPSPPPIGHNRPPLSELVPVEFREALLADWPDFLTRREALIGSASRALAVDDETLGKCGDLVKALRAARRHIDDTHTKVKAPYLEGGRLVDAEKNALIGDLDAAKASVEAIGNAYVAKREAAAKAERDRIAAEQRAAAEAAQRAERDRVAAEQAAARAIAEAEDSADVHEAINRAAEAAAVAHEAAHAAALAPAMPGRSEPVRSDAGATISGKQDWQCEVVDYLAAFRAVKDDPKVREAIDAAVKRRVRAGSREMKGVNIWPVAKANFS